MKGYWITLIAIILIFVIIITKNIIASFIYVAVAILVFKSFTYKDSSNE
jgi:hypothetical protein